MENEIEMKKICSKTFNMPFCLQTTDRTYILFASIEDERQLWLDGFNYVIQSTMQVQKIINVNDQGV